MCVYKCMNIHIPYRETIYMCMCVSISVCVYSLSATKQTFLIYNSCQVYFAETMSEYIPGSFHFPLPQAREETV